MRPDPAVADISPLPRRDGNQKLRVDTRTRPRESRRRKLVARANGALNVVTNSHKGIRGIVRNERGDRAENGPEIYWPRHDLFDAFKCLLYRARRAEARPAQCFSLDAHPISEPGFSTLWSFRVVVRPG